MKVVIASAPVPNGNGYGKSLAFPGDGAPPCGFSDDVAACPAGLDSFDAPILKRRIAPLSRGSAPASHDTLSLASGV